MYFFFVIFDCMGSSLLCAGFSLGEWGLLSSCSAQASRRGGFIVCRAQALSARASVVVVHGISCSSSCGIFPDQGSNLCPSH